ncbi:Hop1p [Ascoidea rubescens DSM 1968]|uniref:DNA-binding protein n=1 Tax=Ascoidea rubescens DSM 1968 TaxID=1344418 RepID=A0A1D2VBA5_9ASCO|nr:DNA-binding protein [Ascoidea rubescens DSM 1968]ODV58948.1 DNA-binding protein [Ascoidea rubescens DSM 1968]
MSAMEIAARDDTGDDNSGKNGFDAAIDKNSGSITKKQSQDLIQTLLLISIGCISFLRNLFPDDCFIDRRYSYDSQTFILDGLNNDINNSNDKRNSVKIKILKNNVSNQIDDLLDLIQIDIFKLISLNYIKSLSLIIYNNDNNNNKDKYFESYFFNFDYDNFNLSVSKNNKKSNKNDDDSININLLDSKKAIQQLIRRLIIITQSLNPLSYQNYLKINLLLNDNCPLNYKFVSSNISFINLLNNNNNNNNNNNSNNNSYYNDTDNDNFEKYEFDNHNPGILNTNHHILSMQILTLNNEISNNNNDNDNNTPNSIPFSSILNDPFQLVYNNLFVSNYFKKPILKIIKSINDDAKDNKDNTNNLNEINEINIFDCECGIKKNLPIFSTKNNTNLNIIQCNSCKKNFHPYCYFKKTNSHMINNNFYNNFNCLNCSASISNETNKNKSTSIEVNNSLLPIYLNLRKFYKLIQRKNFKFPSTFSEIFIDLGFNSSNNNHINIFKKIVIKLFNDKLILIEKVNDTIKKLNSYSNYILNNFFNPNLSLNSIDQINYNEKYYLTLVSRSRNALLKDHINKIIDEEYYNNNFIFIEKQNEKVQSEKIKNEKIKNNQIIKPNNININANNTTVDINNNSGIKKINNTKKINNYFNSMIQQDLSNIKSFGNTQRLNEYNQLSSSPIRGQELISDPVLSSQIPGLSINNKNNQQEEVSFSIFESSQPVVHYHNNKKNNFMPTQLLPLSSLEVEKNMKITKKIYNKRTIKKVIKKSYS